MEMSGEKDSASKAGLRSVSFKRLKAVQQFPTRSIWVAQGENQVSLEEAVGISGRCEQFSRGNFRLGFPSCRQNRGTRDDHVQLNTRSIRRRGELRSLSLQDSTNFDSGVTTRINAGQEVLFPRQNSHQGSKLAPSQQIFRHPIAHNREAHLILVLGATADVNS